MNENFVIGILEAQLTMRVDEFNGLSTRLNGLRNHMAISTNKGNYISMGEEKAELEKRRRELRGEMSALRQAIKKLKEDM